MFKKIFSMALPVALALPVQAQEIDIIPNTGTDFSDVNYANRDVSRADKGLTIEMSASCYGRNLRGVANPIGRNSIVDMTLRFKSGATPNSVIRVRFSSQIVVHNTEEVVGSAQVFSDETNDTAIGNAAITGFGNTLRVSIPDQTTSAVTIDPEGNVVSEGRDELLQSVTFNQTASGWGAYAAVNGPLSGSVEHRLSNDGKVLTINGAFPGENGFCGGFFSPLMLVFEKNVKDLRFEGKTAFKLNDAAPEFNWPKKEDGVHFLAYDRNGDGKVNDGTEMFGEDPKHKNGFEGLADFDKNKDKVINAKDAIFKKLMLWYDKNENGISEKEELVKLNDKGVTELSLNYNKKLEYTYGNRARTRELSTFSWKPPGSKEVKTGEFIDIWLAPVDVTEVRAPASVKKKEK